MKEGFSQKLWQIVSGAVVHFDQHKCPVMAAGLSFFGIISLIPLMLVGVFVFGHILGSSEDAQNFLHKLLLENFPNSAEGMLKTINAMIEPPERAILGWLSFLGLVWSGIKFFNMLQGVLDTVWEAQVERRFIFGRMGRFLWSRIGSFLWGKAVALAVLAVAGVIFWAFFVFHSLSTAAAELDISFKGISIRDFRWLWLSLGTIIPMLISGSMVFLIYVVVPRSKVSLRAALIGASFTAVLLQLSKLGFSFLIVRFNLYGRIYGPLASVIIFMTWLYLSMLILLLGAELGSQCQKVLFSAGADKAGTAE